MGKSSPARFEAPEKFSEFRKGVRPRDGRRRSKMFWKVRAFRLRSRSTETNYPAERSRLHNKNNRRMSRERLRSKFWVPKGRQHVKKVISKCVVCRKLEGKAYSTPRSAALPEFRVTEAPAFSKVGVDFAGLLYVKERTTTIKKVYIALFSCCVTRAIHLELVEDLSTGAFIPGS